MGSFFSSGTSDLWSSTGLYFGSFFVFSIHATSGRYSKESWHILPFLHGCRFQSRETTLQRWVLFCNAQRRLKHGYPKISSS